MAVTQERDRANFESPMSSKEKQTDFMQYPINYTQTKTVRVPVTELRKNRIVTGYENDNHTAEYKMLRTQVMRRMKAGGWRSLAVTSCAPGEGKTLTAINLAYSMAKEVNQTVLLVDFDLRRPAVAKYFGVQPPRGIMDYLTSNTPLKDIMFNPGMERFTVLPNTVQLHNSSEVLSSPRMLELVRELKTRYDSRYIIFDMPPVLAADDVLAFSPYVDAVLLVVEEGKTKKPELTRALELLDGVNVIGTVLNKARRPSIPYYYY